MSDGYFTYLDYFSTLTTAENRLGRGGTFSRDFTGRNMWRALFRGETPAIERSLTRAAAGDFSNANEIR